MGNLMVAKNNSMTTPNMSQNQVPEGNTEGVLVNEPKPGKPGDDTNPPVRKKRSVSSWVHGALDIAGAIPVFGTIFDGANAIYYGFEGDTLNASISAASAGLDLIPGAGTGAKLAELTGKGVTKALAKTASKEVGKAADKAAGKGIEKKATKQAAKKEDGISVKDEKKSNKYNKDCIQVGNPVSPVLGIKFLNGEDELDFSLPSLITLQWQRSYFSDQSTNGWLGQGWSLPFSKCILRKGNGFILVDEKGRVVALPNIENGQCKFKKYEQIFVSREDNNRFCLTDIERSLRYIYSPLNLDSKDPRGEKSDYFPLIAIEDANGNYIRFFYNDIGLPTLVCDAAGQWLKMFFMTLVDSRGVKLHRLQSVSRLKKGRGNDIKHEEIVRYDYSSEGDLIVVFNNKREVTREYKYKNHILIEHSQPGGVVARYEYDQYNERGKVIRHTTNLGQVWLFAYGEGFTRVTDPLERITYYKYNSDKEITGFVDAGGNFHQYKLDHLGRVVNYTMPNGLKVKYTYNSHGQITSITDVLGKSSFIRYNNRNKPIEFTDVMGNTTQYDYDAQGKLLCITNALGNTTKFKYNTKGLITKTSDNDGNSSVFEYDKFGLLISSTDCSGFKKTLTRDVCGNIKDIKFPDGTKMSFSYDSYGKLRSVHYSDGATENYEYDFLGRLVSQSNGLGYKTTWKLDLDGLPVERIDACGNTVLYHYDKGRRIIEITNENRDKFRISYDENDNIICQQDFDNMVTLFQHDAIGQIIKKKEYGTDGVFGLKQSSLAKIETTYYRDKLGRITKKKTHDLVNDSELCSFYQYNSSSLLIQADNNHCKLIRCYDPLGRLVSEESEVMGQHRKLSHSYDCNNNRRHTVLPDDTVIDYLYYGSGGLLQINHNKEVFCEFECDCMHRENSRTQGSLITHTEYNAAGRIIGQKVLSTRLTAHEPHPLISRSYQYDNAENLKVIEENSGKDIYYRYDPLERLIQANHEAFNFDSAHNIRDSNISNNRDSGGNNRIKRYAGNKFFYDAFGNITAKLIGDLSHLRLSYSAEHQLECVDSGINGQFQKTEYGYDALGRRVYKRNKNKTVVFLWDENRLVNEKCEQKSYFYLYNPHSFLPIAQIVKEKEKTLNCYYYHTDQLGTPRELTEPDGEVVWKVQYKAWGNIQKTNFVLINESHKGIHQPFRFQGQYYDEESGLHYNRYRYYDPDTGRFITPDPIGLAGGNNSYQYAPNPTGWVDPLGLIGVNITPSATGTAHNLTLSRAAYPETADHISDAINLGHPSRVTVDRSGAAANRKASLRSYPRCSTLDRDEWPMAMFREGGQGASVRYISPADNRGAGSSIAGAIRTAGPGRTPLPNGSVINFRVGP